MLLFLEWALTCGFFFFFSAFVAASWWRSSECLSGATKQWGKGGDHEGKQDSQESYAIPNASWGKKPWPRETGTNTDLAKDFNLIELNVLFYLFEHGHSAYSSLCGSGTHLDVVVSYMELLNENGVKSYSWIYQLFSRSISCAQYSIFEIKRFYIF